MHWTSKLKQIAHQEASLLKSLIAIAVFGFLSLLGLHLGIKAFAYALVFYSLKGLAWLIVGSLAYMFFQKKSWREVYRQIPRSLLWTAVASIPLTALFAMYYTLIPEIVYQYVFAWGPWISLVMFFLALCKRVTRG